MVRIIDNTVIRNRMNDILFLGLGEAFPTTVFALGLEQDQIGKDILCAFDAIYRLDELFIVED